MAKSQAQILKDFGRSGWTVTATRPDTVTVLTENPANPAEKIPVEQPTGNTVWGITSPTTGQYDEVVVAPGKIESGDVWTTEPVYDPVKGPKEEVKTPTGESTEATSPELAKQRAAQAAAEQALADQRRAEDAQRAKNKADSGYGITDKERADLANTAATQNLTQQQVDLRARELEQGGAQKNRELDIATANNQIASANQALAQKRLELDQVVRDDASKLDWAKFEYMKAKDASDNQISQARLDLERLAQQQTAATQTAANTLGQQTLEQRTTEAAATLAQRKAEAQALADANAQTAAANATTGTLSAINQGATAGANLLQNRAANAQNLVQQGMGPLGQTKHGLLVSPGADFGQNLVQGAAGFATELGGGPEVYTAAANLVRRADPTGAQGQDAARAYAVLSQMFQKYRDTHGGQPSPQEVQANQGAAAQQAGQQAANTTFTSPAIPTPVAPQPPAANMAAANQVPGQNYGLSTTGNPINPATGQPYQPWNAPPGPSFPSFVAPPAPPPLPQPSVTINMGR